MVYVYANNKPQNNIQNIPGMDYVQDFDIETLQDEAQTQRSFLLDKLVQFDERLEVIESSVKKLENLTPGDRAIDIRVAELERGNSRLNDYESRIAKLEGDLLQNNATKTGKRNIYNVSQSMDTESDLSLLADMPPTHTGPTGQSSLNYQYVATKLDQTSYPLFQQYTQSHFPLSYQDSVCTLPSDTCLYTRDTSTPIVSFSTSSSSVAETTPITQRVIKPMAKQSSSVFEKIPSRLEDVKDHYWRQKVAKYYSSVLPPGEFLTNVQLAFLEYCSSQITGPLRSVDIDSIISKGVDAKMWPRGWKPDNSSVSFGNYLQTKIKNMKKKRRSEDLSKQLQLEFESKKKKDKVDNW